MIQVFKPSFDEEEWLALREPLETGWVGLGPKTKEFEEKFAAYVGVRHAIGMNSCTAALHLAMMVMGVEGGEVISPSLTFVATNHAILYNGGIPVFADVEEDTFNIDPEDVRRKVTDRTKAIVAFHYGGQACRMNEILKIAREHNLKVIEDAAHSSGGSYRGEMLGALGDVGCFSFQAIQNLSTGEGGMVTTDDDEAAERIRRLRWMGISKATWDRREGGQYAWQYTVDEVGFKYHMNDLTAAIGLVQFRKLGAGNRRRAEITQRYDEAFGDIPWLKLRAKNEDAQSSHHNYVVRVKDRDTLMDHLAARGIETGVHYYPNHLYPVYARFRTRLEVTERIWKELVTLPLYPGMTDGEVKQVVEGVRSFWPALR